jgi:hypothetical protein
LSSFWITQTWQCSEEAEAHATRCAPLYILLLGLGLQSVFPSPGESSTPLNVETLNKRLQKVLGVFKIRQTSHEHSATRVTLLASADCRTVSSPFVSFSMSTDSVLICCIPVFVIRVRGSWLAWSRRRSWYTPYARASFVRGWVLCSNWGDKQRPIVRTRSVEEMLHDMFCCECSDM